MNIPPSWRRWAMMAFAGAIAAAFFIGWRLVFYATEFSGVSNGNTFPLINDAMEAIKVARSHPALPFFVHGVCGVTAMIAGAAQFILLLHGVRSRWHAILGRLYAFASIMHRLRLASWPGACGPIC